MLVYLNAMSPVARGAVSLAEGGHGVAGVGLSIRHEQVGGHEALREGVHLGGHEQRGQVLHGDAEAAVLVSDGGRKRLHVRLILKKGSVVYMFISNASTIFLLNLHLGRLPANIIRLTLNIHVAQKQK